ncbi:MAG: peptidase M55 [Acidobacteria bacterium]|nr:MAG: peptidase M55 [Acidobacteriota bacterium]
MKSLFTLLLSLGTTIALAQDPVRVFISVDMEGISGIAHSEMTGASGAEYERGRAFMVADVNAAIEGAREAGATEFLVNDSHGTMRNVKIEELLPPTMLISNNSKALGMMEGISAEFDAVFFIGYHAMEGQPGLLAHTGSGGKVADISVNGRSMSEGGMNARVAGSFGVPVALATGDEAFTEEIKALVDGDIETVAVKRHIRRRTAELLHPEEARHLIREGARRAIERLSSFRPTRPREPVTVAITYKSPDLADIAAILPTVERTALYTVTFESPDYVHAYKMIRVLYRNLSE